MINIKLHKNEIELIRESIESSKCFGNEPKLCERVLKKLDKALTIPVVVSTCCEEIGEGFFLGTTCPKCKRPFRKVIE